jgi:hypothetical protein
MTKQREALRRLPTARRVQGGFANEQKDLTPRRRLSKARGCPTLFGARTAGELLKVLKRRDPRTRATLATCYFLLCGMPCRAQPCCRPAYDDDETRGR